MNVRVALLAFPLIALAQSSVPGEQAPPPEVDRALRARATEFLQCYVDGTFRKAFEMVAEDAKDWYFVAPKNPILNFQLGEIKYSDNFSKAEIKVKGTRDMFMFGQQIPMDLTEVENFKIEDGRWVWYQPLAGAAVAAPSVPGAGPAKAPVFPDFPADVSPEGLRAAGQKLLGQVGIDKPEVTLATNQASEATVTVHNAMAGPIRVQMATFEDVPGFSAKLDKTQLTAGENASLVLRYMPSGGKQPEGPVELRLTVSPTNQAFKVTVKFGSAR